jgi:hypothetical protein
LRHFVVDTKNFSFSLMTENTLGKKWLMVYSFSSFVYYLSININYLNLLYSIFKSLFLSSSSSIFYGFIFLLITCNFEIFLCIYTSKTAKIHLLSIITMFTFSLLTIKYILDNNYLKKNFIILFMIEF